MQAAAYHDCYMTFGFLLGCAMRTWEYRLHSLGIHITSAQNNNSIRLHRAGCLVNRIEAKIQIQRHSAQELSGWLASVVCLV